MDQILYVLASELLPGEAYLEQPYLAAVNLSPDSAKTPVKLLTLLPQSRVSLDISPDGLAALLEVTLPASTPTRSELTQTVLLPLFQTTEQRLSGTPTPTDPQVLPLVGILPTWLP